MDAELRARDAMDDKLEALRGALGKPYFESEGVLLFHGDCQEFLTSLSGQQVDLVVTSPPYNIGKEYEAALGLDEYVDWCRAWMNQLYPVVRDRGSFWLNLGYLSVPGRGKAVPLPYLLWDKSPFFMVQEVVWNYGAGVASKRSFSPRNEKFLWYVKNPDDYYFDLDVVRDPDVKYPNQKKNGVLKCNPLGKNPSDVWQIAKVTSGAGRSSVERTPHPAQFPEALVQRVIMACCPPGGVVLDPFVGSGSTCVAARASGRVSVGIELRREYLDIAVSRLTRSRRVGRVANGTDVDPQALQLEFPS